MSHINLYKKAAITAYFLSETDRHWLFNNLNKEENLKLSKYLNELNNIGIPQDEEMKKLLFSRINIDPNDQLHNLIQEIIQLDASILSRFIDREALWIGFFLVRRYPLIFDNHFIGTLANNTKDKLLQMMGGHGLRTTEKADKAILKSISEKMLVLLRGNEKSAGGFSEVIDAQLCE